MLSTCARILKQYISTNTNAWWHECNKTFVVATNLKQRRMYNLTMSCGRVLLDTLRHFLNYKKIITGRIHARGNDDVDNKARDEVTRK
jgi:hypothetical protein